VLLGDLDLLILGVAGDAMISMRSISAGGMLSVLRGDEHHARQVVIDLEVVVVEGRVLLGVEHLEQRDDGSPRKSMPSVDLVEQEQRIGGLALRIDWMTLPGIDPM